MAKDPGSIDVDRDVTFHPDKFSALLVKWRQVPIGWVQQLKRVPRPPSSITAESKAELRNHYKPLIGKWHSALFGGGFFDTKEDAARHIISRAIECSGSKSLLLQAAMRGDSAEVERLLKELRDSVVIEGSERNQMTPSDQPNPVT